MLPVTVTGNIFWVLPSRWNLETRRTRPSPGEVLDLGNIPLEQGLLTGAESGFKIHEQFEQHLFHPCRTGEPLCGGGGKRE